MSDIKHTIKQAERLVQTALQAIGELPVVQSPLATKLEQEHPGITARLKTGSVSAIAKEFEVPTRTLWDVQDQILSKPKDTHKKTRQELEHCLSVLHSVSKNWQD